MLDRLERMSRSGDKDAAKQLLEQLQQMLENLQMAQPGQGGDNEMEQALNELGDMIRKQQQLRDKTFKQGQDSRRDRMRGKQGDQSMGDLQQDQQGLRDRLKKLQEELAKRGMGPGQRGEKGQRGEQQGTRAGPAGSARRPGRRRGRARAGRFRDGRRRRPARRGQCRWRGGFARPALEALRKGAQSLAEAMQQGDGDQPGDGPGNPRGRQQGAANSTDPLGRPMRDNEFSDDYYGENPRRDRRAAGAPDPGRTAPPSRRSVPPADRARLHRAAAEGLLSGLATLPHDCHRARMRVIQYSRDASNLNRDAAAYWIPRLRRA